MAEPLRVVCTELTDVIKRLIRKDGEISSDILRRFMINSGEGMFPVDVEKLANLSNEINQFLLAHHEMPLDELFIQISHIVACSEHF